jgi:ABC-type uncharacterized transport system auxiliary subunit
VKHAILVFLFALAACGSLPAERSIRIDPPAAATAQTLSGHALRLSRLEARGALQERNLAYVEPDAPTEVRQAASIVWEEPPESAAASFLAVALRGAGANVIAVGAAGTPPYTLSGIVQRFELVGSGGTGTAVVALDVTVTDVKSAQPWLNASYCSAVPARDRSLKAVQVAFDAALSDVAGHLIQDMTARAAGGPPPA